jgi:retron-type reverse transcriptase
MTEYEKIYSFENLYRAYKKARCGKRWKEAAAKFEVNLIEALHVLSITIKNKTYTLSPYHSFYVYEPKKRLVMSNAYKDKVVQHALCDEVLKPALSKPFIYDNYASQDGKGTHFGLDRLTGFMREHYRKHGAGGYVLKGDISKYFYSIKHDILKEQLRRYVTDPDVLWLVDMIIDSTEGDGIPIGNQSSQLFALLYMNGLDHFIKEQLRAKYYGRYMDDFYIIHEDREHLKHCLEQITERVEALGLKLNNKTQITPLSQGIDFLGFHSYLTESGKVIRKIRRRSKNNVRRKLKKMKTLVEAGHVPERNAELSYNSWRGHARHGDCYHLIRNMDAYYNKLFPKKEKE